MRTLLISSITVLPFSALATIWQVGPGYTFTAPSQVSTLVGDGDTVNIEAGSYPSDVALWTADDLLLRGVGGLADLESNGLSYGGKAIWVIQGDRTTVEWIAFRECSVPDQNGAGIRQEGHHLTVRHCQFQDNENGILAGEVHPSTIRIEHSEFAYNGYGDGYSHNLYIGNVDSLIFRYNYSHHAHVGHELKSRAWVNVIETNRFSNEADGDASREVDLPNGGTTYLIGNVIQQGPLGQNSNLVGYGLEGLTNPDPHELYAINNTLVNEKSVGSFFAVMNGTDLFKAYSNILAGGGTWTPGWWPATVDTLANTRITDIAMVQFMDAAAYDYRIAIGSPADGGGFPAGSSNSGYPLVAEYEYVHPTDRILRCQQALLDVGAFETCTATGLSEGRVNIEPYLYPNPATDLVTIVLPDAMPYAAIQVFDARGRMLVPPLQRMSDRYLMDVSEL
ncbi:MAG: hypothetical protein IT229_06290, partial [Flavobacteriales bacterium]|nr:hypothetical protein [Flavobacteriales bacterium]